MKKFLIAVLFLIPLIVVLAIQGAGYVIAEWSDEKINAMSVTVKNEFNEEIISGDKIIVPRFLSDGSDGFTYVYIEVKPKICYSDVVEWECDEDEAYEGRAVLEKVEGSKTKYRIVAKEIGNLQMRIYSVTNDKASSTVSIYVTSDAITDFGVYVNAKGDGAMKKVESWEEVTIDRPTEFMTFAQPLEAIGGNLVTWSGFDTEIISVDKNGMIAPTGKNGKSRVSAFLLDKTGTEHWFDFYVVVDSTLLNKFVVTATEISLPRVTYGKYTEAEIKELIWDEVIVKDVTCELSVGDVETLRNDGDSYLFSVNGIEINVRLFEPGAIKFKANAPTDVYMENGGYYLETEYADSFDKGTPQVVYHVSDPTVFSVDEEGLIVPDREGSASVYAEDVNTGAVTEPIEIQIKRRISSFQLNLTSFDNKVGILQHRVWGIYWIGEDEKLTSTYKLGFNIRSVYPDTSYFDLQWTISDDSATVDGDGNITFSEESLGKDITVTATVLVHGLKTNLKRSYTFQMAEEKAINCYTIDEINRAYGDEFGKTAVCLHSDMTLQRPEYYGYIRVSNNLYGNGCHIQVDLMGAPGDRHYWGNICADSEWMNPELEELLIENVSVSAAEELNDDMASNCISVIDMEIPYTVRGVNCRYAWTGVTIRSGKENNVGVVESCILGQCRYTGLYIADTYREDASKAPTVIIRNNVLRDSGCSGVATSADNINRDNITQNACQKLIFEGFTDCYNWKRVDQLGGMLDAVAPSMGELSSIEDLLKSIFADMVSELLHTKYSKEIYVDEEGTEWVCMGMFAMGLMNYIDPMCFDNNNIKGESMKFIEARMDQGIIDLANKMGIFIGNSVYLMTYSFDENNGPRLKPKDACPENKDLYARLTGGLK